MSTSKEEELIGTLWIIAALLAFGFGYRWWGYAFAIKGGGNLAFFCGIVSNWRWYPWI